MTVEGDTNLLMESGVVESDLVGGNLVDGGTTSQKSNVTGNTYVTFAGGEVQGDIIGGGYVRNAAATSNVEGDTHVVVSAEVVQNESQKWVEYVVGGGKAMTNTASDKAVANVLNNTYVTIQGDADTQIGIVAGGGFTRLQSDGGNAEAQVLGTSNVTVTGGILAGVAGGGIAENYSSDSEAIADVVQSNLTISGGTINEVKYGAGNQSTGTGMAVVGGGIALSTSGGTTSSAIQDIVTNITSGDINGHVIAGGVAHGSGTTVAPDANLDGTTIEMNISGSTITGNVYAGGASVDNGTVRKMDVATYISGDTVVTGKVVAGNYLLTTAEGGFTAEDGAADDSEVLVEIGGNSQVLNGVVIATDNAMVNIGENATVKTTAEDGSVVSVTARDATVGFVGNDATVIGKLNSTGTNNTILFVNYNGDFANEFSGFATLRAEKGSVVSRDTLSTDAEGNNVALTLAGDGEFIVDTVTATTGNGLTVGDGSTTTTLTVNESLTTANKTTVANLGTISVAGTVADDGSITTTVIEGQTTLEADSTLEVTGLDDQTFTTEQLDTFASTITQAGSAGLIDLGNVGIAGLEENHGHIKYSTTLGKYKTNQPEFPGRFYFHNFSEECNNKITH